MPAKLSELSLPLASKGTIESSRAHATLNQPPNPKRSTLLPAASTPPSAGKALAQWEREPTMQSRKEIVYGPYNPGDAATSQHALC